MIITIEKDDLIKAMQKYNTEALANPQNFDEIEDTKDCAKRQVDQLLSYLPSNKEA